MVIVLEAMTGAFPFGASGRHDGLWIAKIASVLDGHNCVPFNQGRSGARAEVLEAQGDAL